MYRDTGYIDDGAYGFQCLDCKERFAVCQGVEHWKLCPCCGAAWVQKPSRLPSVPRWAFDKWGNDVPYGVRLWPAPPAKGARVEAEYRIVGHSSWSREFTYEIQPGRSMYWIGAALKSWKELDGGEPLPWTLGIDYRMTWNGRVVLTKRVLCEGTDNDARS